MTRSPLAPPDDQVVDYLLGTLPPEDTHRLDELSIVDEEFAARLQVAEHDLFDDYAKGRLSGAALDHFTAKYLSDSQQIEKVLVARLLQGTRAPRRDRLAVRWPARLAIAASVLLVAGGFTLFERARGREAPIETARTVAPVETPVVTAPTVRPAPAPSTRVLAFVLLPPTRGIADAPPITIPSGTVTVELDLQLEANDFPQYQAVLRRPPTSGALWTSSRLPAIQARGTATVPLTVTVPLTPGRYLVDLTGFPARGRSRILSSYSFRVIE
jgi:hypothetical protein